MGEPPSPRGGAVHWSPMLVPVRDAAISDIGPGANGSPAALTRSAGLLRGPSYMFKAVRKRS